MVTRSTYCCLSECAMLFSTCSPSPSLSVFSIFLALCTLYCCDVFLFQLLATTFHLVCVFQGQLLPEPLCYTGDILQYISSYEVYLLLVNIWTYVKVRRVLCIKWNMDAGRWNRNMTNEMVRPQWPKFYGLCWQYDKLIISFAMQPTAYKVHATRYYYRQN